MSEELSTQDALRLNVLLQQKPQAIRIDPTQMVLHALLAEKEVCVPLQPNTRPDRYLKRVRELLSGHATGSPGGYPVHLQRWTRMGQMRDTSLEQLLLLGEPEAVVAAVSAPGLTDELARRAWWAMPDLDNARHMLRHKAVVEGRMGSEVAQYLYEHLAFETESEQIIDSAGLILQPGLLDQDARLALWQRARRKPILYLGFLESCPDDLPGTVPDDHPNAASLAQLAENPVARLLQRCWTGAGALYLDTLSAVLEKPADQEVLGRVLDNIAGYFAPVRVEGRADLTLPELELDATTWSAQSSECQAVLKCMADARPQLSALRFMSGLSYGVVRSELAGSTAAGSLMRRRIAPVLAAIQSKIGLLRQGA